MAKDDPIFSVCPPNFVRCEGHTALVVEVTEDLSGWQTVEMTYFMTPTLDFSRSPSLLFFPCLSLTLVLVLVFSFSMFFPTCMPHYILKVNPINTEITLEDKLLTQAFFGLITTQFQASFASTISTSGNSYSNFIHSDKANHLFSLKILTWNKGQMKELRNVLIYLNPLKCISFSDLFSTSHDSNSVSILI